PLQPHLSAAVPRGLSQDRSELRRHDRHQCPLPSYS
ncbi:hypothetical protein, partial [Aeromonas hydrophila]